MKKLLIISGLLTLAQGVDLMAAQAAAEVKEQQEIDYGTFTPEQMAQDIRKHVPPSDIREAEQATGLSLEAIVAQSKAVQFRNNPDTQKTFFQTYSILNYKPYAMYVVGRLDFECDRSFIVKIFEAAKLAQGRDLATLVYKHVMPLTISKKDQDADIQAISSFIRAGAQINKPAPQKAKQYALAYLEQGESALNFVAQPEELQYSRGREAQFTFRKRVRAALVLLHAGADINYKNPNNPKAKSFAEIIADPEQILWQGVYALYEKQKAQQEKERAELPAAPGGPAQSYSASKDASKDRGSEGAALLRQGSEGQAAKK
jgi:hypothetical protein